MKRKLMPVVGGKNLGYRKNYNKYFPKMYYIV